MAVLLQLALPSLSFRMRGVGKIRKIQGSMIHGIFTIHVHQPYHQALTSVIPAPLQEFAVAQNSVQVVDLVLNTR